MYFSQMKLFYTFENINNITISISNELTMTSLFFMYYKENLKFLIKLLEVIKI